ncbi:hypothetical protein BDZ89DRAFT_940567 [Hymenopellis radicata]|nr:hypothetical protein BDZ89DRAFT_940567 [Hymenopellis radicata]
MGAITTDKAYLIAVFLESIFYGINLLLFIIYLFLAPARGIGNNKKLILPLAVAMFLLSTTRLILDFYRLFNGFILHSLNPGAFFNNVSDPSHVAKTVVHTFNCILGDVIIVWRCYLVWGRNMYICVGPALLILASTIAGLGQAATFSRCTSAFDPALLGWNEAVFTLSFITNVGVTLLIALRIVYLKKHQSSMLPSDSFYQFVLITVVESGLVYSAALLVNVVLYFSRDNAFYIVYDPIGQLAVIVPTTIVVTAQLGLLTRTPSASVELNTTKNRTAVPVLSEEELLSRDSF